MAKFNSIKNSFLAGEVSPRLYGRTDLDSYTQGCEEVRNAIIYPQGGFTRRPGTVSSNVTDFVDLEAARMIPLVISKLHAYIFIFTEETFTVDTGVTDDILTGLYVVNTDTGVVGTINYAFESTTGYTRWRGFSTFVELQQCQFAQKGTTLFVTHPNHPPIALEFLAEDTFRLLNFWAFNQLGQDPLGSSPTSDLVALAWPYDTRNVTAITITPSHTSGSNRTLTASANIFVSGMIGSLIRLTHPGATLTGVAVIKAIGGLGLTATVDILVPFGDTTATDNWALSMWSSARGFPRTVCFFESRIYYGGSTQYPAYIWGSRIGNIADLRQEHYIDDSPGTVTNDDPYSVEIASDELNAVQWMSPGKTLVIGTGGREVVAQGPDETQALGPLNLGFSPESALGSSYVRALRVQNAILFIQRTGDQIREFIFNFQENSYKSLNLTFAAEHCIKKNIDITADLDQEINEVVDMAKQEAGNSVIWCLDLTGNLFGITRDRDLNISAFHFHKIGGSFGTREGGKILSICTVPATYALGNNDDLWMLVRRTIDGNDVTYLELMPKEFQGEEMFNESALFQNKPFYCDSISMYQGAATTTPSAPHLPNTEIEVIADGFYLGRMTTDGSGGITLDTAATEVIMGLPYRTKVIPLGTEAGSVIGSAQGQIKRVDQVTIRFVRTIGAKFGPNEDQMDEIDFKDTTTPMDEPTPLFSGDKVLKFPSSYTRDSKVILIQDAPLPFQVSCIISHGVTND